MYLYYQGNELGETLSRQTADFKLPQHHSSHRDLTPYAELMLWLKQADNKSFVELSKVHIQYKSLHMGQKIYM